MVPSTVHYKIFIELFIFKYFKKLLTLKILKYSTLFRNAKILKIFIKFLINFKKICKDLKKIFQKFYQILKNL